MTTGSALTRIYQDHLRVLESKAYDPYFGESLFKGPWGILLYLFYYERYVDNSAACAGSWLQQLYAALRPQPVAGYSYCNGTTGPFWLLQHLYAQRFIDIEIEELSAGYLPAAIAESEKCLSAQNFDLLHGSAGICHHLLTYAHLETVRAHLEKFVAALTAASHMTAHGRSIPVFVLFDPPRESGVDTFSLAHGTCSLLILLSRACLAGIAPDTCRQLISECIDFMWHHQNPRLPGTPHALFPGILDGRAPYSRLSWCYGDFNVALALWHCGKALQEDRWQQQALDVMHYTLRRDTDQRAGIVDACLCHGSAGIAAFYRRFWQETGDPAFRKAADHWHHNTLQKVVFSDQPGVYGVRGWEGVDKQWEYCWDLLDGSSGIGLSLLSHTLAHPLCWDEAFLLS